MVRTIGLWNTHAQGYLLVLMMVTTVTLLMLRAGTTGEGLVFTFQLLLAVAAMMVIVHVWGAVQRIQPIAETLEIGMYAGMFVLTVLFYPA
jgi:hypothetical protein